MTPDIAYKYLFQFTVIFLLMYAVSGMYRSVRGPEVCDRVMGINMVGSAVTTTMLALIPVLNEGYLADIGIIYALVNFLSVVVLRRVYGRGMTGNVKGKTGSSRKDGQGDKK